MLVAILGRATLWLNTGVPPGEFSYAPPAFIERLRHALAN